MASTLASRKHGALYSGVLLLVFGAFALYATSRAKGPNLDLHFEQTLESTQAPGLLGAAVQYPINWPAWFHGLKRAELVNGLGHPHGTRDQVIVPGALVELEVQAKREPKPFLLTFEVTTYVPNHVLILELVRDPSLKITPFLRTLSWEIRMSPSGGGTRLTGSASGQTTHWKSRLFGSIAESILMRQFFYPDIEKLGKFEHPLAPGGSPVILK